MIKVRVWMSDSKGVGSKCIFNGDVAVLPRNGEYVVIREGCGEAFVTEVCHHFDSGRVDIVVNTTDDDNEYGSCLING